MALLLDVALLLVVALGPARAGAAAAEPAPGATLVLVDELTWAGAPAELDGFAMANLSMRSSSARSGAADTYLTIGKGNRSAALPGEGVGRVEPTAGGGVRLADWPELVRRDRALHYGGVLGAMGQAVEDAGGRLALVAREPAGAAAAAAANASGIVARYHSGGADGLSDAKRAGEHVVVSVDASELVATLATLAGSCALVASASTPDGNRHLGVLAASPECGLGHDGLGSDSTHDDHLATLPDVTRTFLRLAGAVSTGGVRASAAIERQALVDADARTRVADGIRTELVWLFVLLHLVGALVAVRRPRARAAVACGLLAVPAAAFLVMAVPWWRWGPWAAVLVGGVIAGVVGLGGAALCWREVRGRRDVRVAVGALAGLAAAVVAVDAVFGGPLEIDAPFGNSPVVAGRFFGVGNIGSGFLVAGMLVAAGLALDAWGRRALPGVVAVLAGGLVVLGAPWFGADAGGMVYGGLACGVLVVGYLRGRVGARWLAGLAVAAVLVVVLLALVDAARGPGSESHLGRAVASESAGDLALRKGARAVHSVTNPMALIVVVGVGALVIARPAPTARLSGRPALRASGWAVAVAAVAGSILNDSGVVVAAAVVAVAWPAALAVPDAGVGTSSRGEP